MFPILVFGIPVMESSNYSKALKAYLINFLIIIKCHTQKFYLKHSSPIKDSISLK